MRKITAAIFMLFMSFSLLSQTTGATKPPKTKPEKEGYVKATVIKYEVENCGYILVLADKKKLQPDQLADEFKKNRLKVWVKYTVPKTQIPTTCMAGQSVKVEAIKKR